MGSRLLRLIAVAPLTAALLVGTGGGSASAAVSHLCGQSHSMYHNGHYDSWVLITHYDSAQSALFGHVHVMWNKTHDRYEKQENCPVD